MVKWLSLALGGTLGTFARYSLAGLVYKLWGTTFPYGTLIVNLTGCWLIGFLVVLSEEKFMLGPTARIFLMIGFCGAYTTFSTFMLETANLMKNGENLHALTNVLLSVLLGFLALRLGILSARLI